MGESHTETPEDLKYKNKLTPQQYEVARLKGTERPFTGQYWDHTDAGVYKCVCCDTPLFESNDKFDAGCGWPSFAKPVKESAVKENVDMQFGMVRREVVCAKCGAHQGHVFEDGPESRGGLRYCINSASINFSKDGTKKPSTVNAPAKGKSAAKH